MSADGEYARGTTFANYTQGGGPLSFTIPACPGISHVIDAVSMGGYLYNGSTAAPATAIAGSVNSTSLSLTVFFIGTGPTAANGLEAFSGQWTGPVAFAMGEAVTIQFNAPAITGAEYLQVSWHDV